MRPTSDSDKASAAARLRLRLRRAWRRLLDRIKLRLQQKRWLINVSLAVALGAMIATPSFTHPLVSGLLSARSLADFEISILLLLLAVAIYALAFMSVGGIA